MITQSIVDIGKQFNIEPALIAAVKDVESSGNGFLTDGRLKILFEGQRFWHELLLLNITPNQYLPQYSDVLYPKWDSSKYKGGAAEYDRLNKASEINSNAAHKSASYGTFQIMGGNYHLCGFADVFSFINFLQQGEDNNVIAFMDFLKGTGLLIKLVNKDWIGFAQGYNGRLEAQHDYHTKIENAYNQYRSL